MGFCSWPGVRRCTWVKEETTAYICGSQSVQSRTYASFKEKNYTNMWDAVVIVTYIRGCSGGIHI
jgi:hypothetical protein